MYAMIQYKSRKGIAVRQKGIKNMSKQREISIEELKKSNVSTWSKKDNSPRGCKTVLIDEIQVGDEVVIDNYFTLVTE